MAAQISGGSGGSKTGRISLPSCLSPPSTTFALRAPPCHAPPLRPEQHQHLPVLLDPTERATDYICLDIDSAPSSLPSASSRSSGSSHSTTPSTTPTTPIESSSPIPIPRKWPSGAYTVDMANGFLRMEAPELDHLPIATRFQRVFKTDSPYKARTYSDARLRWSWGPQGLRASALDAGKTGGIVECVCGAGPTQEVMDILLHILLHCSSFR
ncbi:hypothetical protein DFH08DRAFT_960192 [Mycena albidolilacea]|uniref:Uncharacterized protein n=1 Tax=Mycena albidolilacea TaxID=1033008 RepID=A0AAD7A2J5_9AGAR|nr:hypothetical protein DFH08DRAFT_960192 [Mycena albidolilacea]